jgi:trimeric autotransporter adhesin
MCTGLKRQWSGRYSRPMTPRRSCTILDQTVCRWAAGVASALLATMPVAGQCEPAWDESYGYGGLSDAARVLYPYDDGSGAALYVGGEFWSAGTVEAPRIARWDGHAWSAVGEGMNDAVRTMTAFDDGSGTQLYAGGYFVYADGNPVHHIARWDGAAWHAVGDGGLNKAVFALEVFDDGGGPTLFAGGEFTFAGDKYIGGGVAKWDGSEWVQPASNSLTLVLALAVFDDGTGPALYAGDLYGRVSRLQAGEWVEVGQTEFNAAIYDLAVFDDGGGEALYACGAFKMMEGGSANRIARWDGDQWSPLGGGLGGEYARTMLILPPGLDGGAALAVGGNLTTAGGLPVANFAVWKDGQWSAWTGGFEDTVRSLALFDDGAGPVVYAAGAFAEAPGGGDTDFIARRGEAGWAPLIGGADDTVRVFLTSPPGPESRIYAGGDFSSIGGVPAEKVACWDGSTWNALGGGVDGSVRALAWFDDGEGVALHVAGSFSAAGGTQAANIARWDGNQWTRVADGVNGVVNAMVSYDDDGPGPNPAKLYVTGEFLNAGFVAAKRIAAWDGASWSAVGKGLDKPGETMVVYNDGTGPALYTAGTFIFADNKPAALIARWDGSAWTEVGTGLSGLKVQSLVAHDDGLGPCLYAGGYFAKAGGQSASNVARWNGSAWSALAGGVADEVYTLATFADDQGSGLYAGGYFLSAGGAPAAGLARWDGQEWASVGDGVGRSPRAMAEYDNGRPSLFIGGEFMTAAAGRVSSSRLARWGCDPTVCEADLNQDGTLDLFDFLMFVNLFGESDPAADCTADGAFDLFDFLCFANLFNEGC